MPLDLRNALGLGFEATCSADFVVWKAMAKNKVAGCRC